MNGIEAKALRKVYRSTSGTVVALDGVEFSLPAGKCLAVCGPSGSGKSTLLGILGCLLKPTSGAFFLDGEEIPSLGDTYLTELRRKRIGFIFQQFNLLEGMDVEGNVALPLIPLGWPRTRMRERAMECLEMVGMGKRVDSRVNELSGGEQQRVAVARALVHEPDILLADEPTSNVDADNAARIAEIFLALKGSAKTLIVASHDEHLLSSGLVDDVLYLTNGKVIQKEVKDET